MLDVTIYLITPMTGYDRADMVARAKYMVTLGAEYGVRVISPVLEEHTPNLPGALIQSDEYQLFRFWKRDKQILRNRDGKGAHGCIWDRSHLKSVGGEREYGLTRYCLFKPTVCIVPSRTITVAQWEDDCTPTDERGAFQYFATVHGTRSLRWKWRIKMLARSLPGWIVDQIAAFR